MDISRLEPGPIRHPQLTVEQLDRIRKIHEIFSEVNDISLEKTVENFTRDVDPEQEIVIWERMARAYTEYCAGQRLALEEKKAVYEILLLRSMVSEEYVLENLWTRLFSRKKVREILSYYQGPEEPLTGYVR